MQQARAQQQMKKKQAEAQKRAIAPMPNTNGTSAATHMSTQQLQQAALTLQNPGAGQSGGTLTAQEGVLKMQALQNEVLRQQAVKAAALQAENASRPANPAAVQPAVPIQREMPVWRGRMMAVPGSEQIETSMFSGDPSFRYSKITDDLADRLYDLSAPSVVVMSMRGTDPEAYMPKSWPTEGEPYLTERILKLSRTVTDYPNLGTTLTLSGARKLDMAKLQNLAKRSQCPFVEFRAAADDSQMNQEAQQVNSRAVVQFAAKLASGQLVSSERVRRCVMVAKADVLMR